MPNYNHFPVNYQPADAYYPKPGTAQYYPQNNWYQQPYQQQMYPVQNQNNPNNVSGEIKWIHGEEVAKNYSDLRPGTPVALWDDDKQVIYIKSLDQFGKPTMTILDYTERVENTELNEEQLVEYATKEDFERLLNRLDDLNEQIKNVCVPDEDIVSKSTTSARSTTSRKGTK